jgi:hypothetical protein
LLYQITSEDWAGFLITIKASDARLPKSRGMRRTSWYAAVTRDEGNAADDVLMVDQGERVNRILSLPCPGKAGGEDVPVSAAMIAHNPWKPVKKFSLDSFPEGR